MSEAAIIDAVAARSPRSVLDVGCGEGWLARAPAVMGTHVLGIDAIPSLIECARRSGGGDCRVMSFEDVAAGGLKCRVDAAVCNFSLLGNTSVRKLLAALPPLLNPGMNASGLAVSEILEPLHPDSQRPASIIFIAAQRN
ncbi:MAG: class I SAM-dependent methyltransferase [Steroidobacteraceae bacterium]